MRVLQSHYSSLSLFPLPLNPFTAITGLPVLGTPWALFLFLSFVAVVTWSVLIAVPIELQTSDLVVVVSPVTYRRTPAPSSPPATSPVQSSATMQQCLTVQGHNDGFNPAIIESVALIEVSSTLVVLRQVHYLPLLDCTVGKIKVVLMVPKYICSSVDNDPDCRCCRADRLLSSRGQSATATAKYHSELAKCFIAFDGDGERV